jgi:hypothetical protein
MEKYFPKLSALRQEPWTPQNHPEKGVIADLPVEVGVVHTAVKEAKAADAPVAVVARKEPDKAP